MTMPNATTPETTMSFLPTPFDEDPCFDSGDSTWVLTSSVLVLGMIPGLALFEAGLLRRKNTISILMQCLTGLVVLAVLWFLFGYSLVFSNDYAGLIGDLKKAVFLNVKFKGCTTIGGHQIRIPEAVYAIFQQNFAAVTPLLITGSVAERMRWQPYLAFVIAFEILVYYPIAHWIWGGGWLAQLGMLDFAGGAVIHASSGCAALVLTGIFLGRRVDYEKYHGAFPHSDMRLATIGAAFLWIGWYGFNGGSALASGPIAAHAVINTQVGACFSGLAWIVLGWKFEKKPSMIHILNGAIAGMAGITPASGYIDTPWAILVSAILGVSSYFAASALHHTKIDDALEVSCVHGLTGVIGTLALGFFASTDVNPRGSNGLAYGGGGRLLGIQALGLVVVVVYSSVVTLGVLFVMGRITRLRARPEHERQGLDNAYHLVDVIHEDEDEWQVAQRAYRDDVRKGAGGSVVGLAGSAVKPHDEHSSLLTSAHSINHNHYGGGEYDSDSNDDDRYRDGRAPIPRV